MNNSRTRGRPRGTTTTRADILAAARRRFFTDGYDRVTLRVIAQDAGVDVALISYYFGSKKGLFGASMALEANPAELLVREIDGPLNSLPERLAGTVVRVWDDPESGPSLRSFFESVVRDPQTARGFRELIEHEMLPRIAERLGGDVDATRRAALMTSQIAGMIFSRYVLRLEPIASMPADELARRVAANLRAALARPTPRTALPRARPAGDRPRG
jgi:AcrR family transcriptional regulator